MGTYRELNTLGVESFLIAPEASWDASEAEGLQGIDFINDQNSKKFEELIEDRGWMPSDTIIATHGCWRYPTRWGSKAAEMGFHWIFCPHGMLEPWPMRQKRILKKLYLMFREAPMIRRSSVIRGSSSPESETLKRLFPNNEVQTISNGINPSNEIMPSADKTKTTILFLGRLHKKKCPYEMATGFVTSSLANNPRFHLVVAGPDQGERAKIEAAISKHKVKNVEVFGPQYGELKIQLLRNADYFVLTSRSEGFSSALVEAMAFRCVPILSSGSNFPEAVEAGVAIHTDATVNSIRKTFDDLEKTDRESLLNMQDASRLFIKTHYTVAEIAKQQYKLALRLLGLNS